LSVFHKQKKKIEGKKEGDRKREEGWEKDIKKQIKKEITQKEIKETHTHTLRIFKAGRRN